MCATSSPRPLAQSPWSSTSWLWGFVEIEKRCLSGTRVPAGRSLLVSRKGEDYDVNADGYGPGRSSSGRNRIIDRKRQGRGNGRLWTGQRQDRPHRKSDDR